MHSTPEIAPDYAFDGIIENSFYTITQDQIVAPFSDDINNNIEAFDVASQNGDEQHLDVRNVSKREYSYGIVENIKNFWAGPSYWKFSNRMRSQSSQETAQNKGRRRLKEIERPKFNGNDDSDNEYIDVDSIAAQKVPNCNYRRWSPDKLRLPLRCDFSRDLFDAYKFMPSQNIFAPNQIEPLEMNDLNEIDDIPVSILHDNFLHERDREGERESKIEMNIFAH